MWYDHQLSNFQTSTKICEFHCRCAIFFSILLLLLLSLVALHSTHVADTLARVSTCMASSLFTSLWKTFLIFPFLQILSSGGSLSVAVTNASQLWELGAWRQHSFSTSNQPTLFQMQLPQIESSQGWKQKMIASSSIQLLTQRLGDLSKQATAWD